MRRSILVLALLSACSGKNALEPGTVVGTFRVEAHKTEATCGDAAGAADPWVFQVRLSRDASTLYWLQNRAPIGGRIGADRKATLTAQTTVTARAQTRTSAACTVTRTDTLTAALGPDQPLGDAGTGGFSTLTGTLSYALAAEDGSDCEDMTDPAVSVLPCKTVYSLSATKVGP